jgi:hypothetical protein
MPLITTIETAKEFVKLNYNNSSSALADMAGADARFIIPLIGRDLYDTLLDEITNNVDTHHELIELCRAAAAPLAYWLDLPTMQTKITDNGISTFENTSQVGAHRWEYEALKDALQDKGCFALEALLDHLYANAEDYAWTQPTDYNLIFKTGKEFTVYYPLFQPYRSFESMRAVVRRVEDEFIRAAIGDDFFEELRDATDPTDEEAKAIKIIKKAVAPLTMAMAVEMLPIKSTPFGFTVLLQASEKANQGEGQAADNLLSMMRNNAERSGQSYLLQLKEYLNKNASESVFATYFASEFYTSPATTAAAIDPNSTRKIFGM